MTILRYRLMPSAIVLLLASTFSVLADSLPTPPPSPKAVEALRELESPDPYQRQKAFLRLEALREPSTAESIRAYLHHKDQDMRAFTIRAVAAIEGPQSVPTLLESLKTERSARVRRAALLGLEPLQQSSADILPAFLKALRDKDTEVRMAAVDIVSRIDDPRAREAILVRAKRERRRDVRRVLVPALRRIGQP